MARPDGVVVDGRSNLYFGVPAVPPLGVRPLVRPPEMVDLARPWVEENGPCYVKDYTRPCYSVRAESGRWCIYTVVLGGPEEVHGRFASADETIDRLLVMLGAGPPDHLFCRAGPAQPVQFSTSYRTADVVGLALGIDADGAYDRLPLLADALMDAGCDDENLLAHARADGHVRGCWLVDLVLGRE
jgi:hypothetical protein